MLIRMGLGHESNGIVPKPHMYRLTVGIGEKHRLGQTLPS